MIATLKWIGAGLSGIACGSMALLESGDAASLLPFDFMPLISACLFPGLALMILGMVLRPVASSKSSSGKVPKVSNNPPTIQHVAKHTAAFYRAVCQREAP